MFDFTNYRDHPEQREYLVVLFYIEEQADFFESLLKQEGLFYERDREEEDDKTTYYFAVKRQDRKRVLYLNNVTIGKFRERFIPSFWLRWIVFIVSAVVVTLAIWGYVRDQL